MAKEIKITLKRSTIGRLENQKRTVRALGLKRLHQTVTHKDTAIIRGMINRVSHLVETEEIG